MGPEGLREGAWYLKAGPRGPAFKNRTESGGRRFQVDGTSG